MSKKTALNLTIILVLIVSGLLIYVYQYYKSLDQKPVSINQITQNNVTTPLNSKNLDGQDIYALTGTEGANVLSFESCGLDLKYNYTDFIVRVAPENIDTIYITSLKSELPGSVTIQCRKSELGNQDSSEIPPSNTDPNEIGLFRESYKQALKLDKSNIKIVNTIPATDAPVSLYYDIYLSDNYFSLWYVFNNSNPDKIFEGVEIQPAGFSDIESNISVPKTATIMYQNYGLSGNCTGARSDSCSLINLSNLETLVPNLLDEKCTQNSFESCFVSFMKQETDQKFFHLEVTKPPETIKNIETYVSESKILVFKPKTKSLETVNTFKLYRLDTCNSLSDGCDRICFDLSLPQAYESKCLINTSKPNLKFTPEYIKTIQSQNEEYFKNIGKYKL